MEGAVPIRVTQQAWHDAVFLHWPVSAGELRAHVPPALVLEELAGSCWVGLVAFSIDRVGLGRGPRVPSRIPEINLRTYVRHQDDRGVWFFDLETTSRLLVAGGKALFHLPYRRSAVTVADRGTEVSYSSTDQDRTLELTYSKTGDRLPADDGTAEQWFAERYQLFAPRGPFGLLRCRVEHRPWRLQATTGEIRIDQGRLPGSGPLAGPPGHAMYSPGVDATIRWPEPVAERVRSAMDLSRQVAGVEAAGLPAS